MPEPLPDRLAAVLRFEARYRRANADTRTNLARQAFGLSLTRYHQRLIIAVEHPAAPAFAPDLVAELRDVLSRRRARHTIRTARS